MSTDAADALAFDEVSVARSLRAAHKVALRRVRLRLLVSGKLAESRKVAKVLGNDDMLDCYADVAGEAIDVSAAGEFGAFPDGIIKLVEFLLDHIDEIMKIVQVIIDLFTKSA